MSVFLCFDLRCQKYKKQLHLQVTLNATAHFNLIFYSQVAVHFYCAYSKCFVFPFVAIIMFFIDTCRLFCDFNRKVIERAATSFQFWLICRFSVNCLGYKCQKIK